MTLPISAVMPSYLSAAIDSGSDDDSTTGATSSSSSSSSSSSDASVGGLSSDSFLQLLVAQLENQDPMNPTDSTTYITEESEFSMVQSMNAVSTQMSNLLSSQQLQTASSLIGENVTYLDSSGDTVTGVVTAASPGSSSTGALLRVGTDQVPLSSISQITAASAATTSSGS